MYYASIGSLSADAQRASDPVIFQLAVRAVVLAFGSAVLEVAADAVDVLFINDESSPRCVLVGEVCS